MVTLKRAARLGVGLDLGAHSLRCVEVDVDEAVVRKAWRRTLHPERKAVADVLQGEALQERLLALASRLHNDMEPGEGLVTALQGEGTWLSYLELPPLPSSELHIAAQAAASRLMPFALEEATLSTPLVPPLTEGRSGVLLVAARKEPAAQRLALLASSGLTVRRLEVIPLALARAFGRNHPERSAGFHALVYLGFSATHVLAVRNGLPYFVHDFALGVRHFLSALQGCHGVDWAQAQALFEEGDARSLDAACGRTLVRWLRELTRTVDYLRRKVAPLPMDDLWIAGGGDYLRGCQLLIAAHTQSVVCLEHWNQIMWQASGSPGDAGLWAAAVGMALEP